MFNIYTTVEVFQNLQQIANALQKPKFLKGISIVTSLHKMIIAKKVFFYLVVFLLFTSCSQSKIEIGSLDIRVLQLESSDSSVVPRMSVFFSYKNSLGQNDFYNIKILHKNTGLTWYINPNELFFFKNNSLLENEFIVGTNKIAFPYGEVIPGEYLMSVSKLNTESFSKSFSLTEPDIIEKKFPVKIELKNKQANFTTNDKILRCTIILLGADMQAFYVKELQTQNFEIINMENILNEKKDAHYVQFLFEISGNEFLSKIIQIE